jgi:hypothetical protein
MKFPELFYRDCSLHLTEQLRDKHLLEIFSVSAVVTFLCLQCPEIFVTLRHTLFLETARSHSEPNQGNRVRVSLSGWRIQSMG